MTIPRTSFLLATLALALFAAPFVYAADNLIANPSLETAGSGGNPANWSRVSWGSPTPTFAYPVAGKDGVGNGAAVTLGANSSGDARWAHDSVTVEPGATYQYSNWYKSNVATEVNIQYISSSGAVSWDWVASLPSSANAWKQVTANITIPAGITKVVVFHLIDKKGTLTVDEFSLAKPGSDPPPPPPPDAPTLNFTASPTSIQSGNQATLSWDSTNTTSCTASGAWSGTKAIFGSQSVSPTATATYSLSCTGAGGVVSKDVTVIVATVPPPPPSGSTFAEGMVSITFDDSWTSQYTNALPILQTAGLKGTFYLTTEPIQNGWDDFMTPSQVQTIAQQGHEIAGHTITHVDLTSVRQNRINQEIRNSKTYLQNLTGKVVTSFAYPYGAFNNTVKTLLKNAGYTSARGIEYDILNTPTTDDYVLNSQCIEAGDSIAEVKARIDAAKANKQWYVLCIHEVKNNGDQYSMTPATFQDLVNYIKNSGVKVVTVAEGAALLQ